jgi:hypothetical protein
MKLKDEKRSLEVQELVLTRRVGMVHKNKKLVKIVSRNVSYQRYNGHDEILISSQDGNPIKTIETWDSPDFNLQSGPKYFYVDNKYSKRSDLISNMMFGTPIYNWWILYSNGLSEDEDLLQGMTLSIFSPPQANLQNEKFRRPF